MLVADEPRQQDLDPPPRFDDRGYTFAKRARYDITARVLRREIYRVDGGAALAPVDVAVGWGPVSDSSIVDRLEFSQMGRFFYWKPKDFATFPLDDGTLDHARRADAPDSGHEGARRPGLVDCVPARS